MSKHEGSRKNGTGRITNYWAPKWKKKKKRHGNYLRKNSRKVERKKSDGEVTESEKIHRGKEVLEVCE